MALHSTNRHINIGGHAFVLAGIPIPWCTGSHRDNSISVLTNGSQTKSIAKIGCDTASVVTIP
jgi:hypothetical protein